MTPSERQAEQKEWLKLQDWNNPNQCHGEDGDGLCALCHSEPDDLCAFCRNADEDTGFPITDPEPKEDI